MPWFAAHKLMVLRPETPVGEPLLCWENIILLEAEYDSDIWEWQQSEQLMWTHPTNTQLTPYYTVPARWEFAGTRKIVTVRQDSDGDRLANGDELTFNTLYLDQTMIDSFVSGDECDAIIGSENEEPPSRNMERQTR